MTSSDVAHSSMQKLRQSCQDKVPHLRLPIDVKVSWAQVFPGIQRAQICETQPAYQLIKVTLKGPM